MSAEELQPGTRLRHKQSGDVVVLDRRKRPEDNHRGLVYFPGWWLTDDAGGLADSVIDAERSDWELM